MIKLFNRLVEQFSNNEPESEEMKIELAAAVLFYELGRADFSVDDVELGQIREALVRTFGLDQQAAKALLEQAIDVSKDSHDYHQFTKIIHQQFDYPQKVALVKCLWRIAIADGKVDPHEEHLLRKIADLIYVSSSDFLQAKHQVLDS